MNNKLFLIIIPFIIFGCTLAKVKVEVLSERTTLENQVLGTYKSLDREMLLVASVRGVDPSGNIIYPPKHSQEHKDVIAAMQLQSFHADDIQNFKRLGWAGENRNGLLSVFEMDRKNIPPELKEFAERYKKEEFDSVISQVNKSREIIMLSVINLNENLTKDDLPKIHRIFGKLNAENAVLGEKIQTEDGKWVTK
ncbi:MAG: DUF1318 domain-containing protein [Desulfobacterales bacterium]|nr:DUF1318 domain-containing protein [Desulfobacterales bacterium]MBF0398888.1 DUF1318 domain-containing protein [Desulfobacterales bacterium]